ncbi:MAG: hypothetical protein GY809_19840 [Planctomycetes bacterium]|nr:hypothetical protein [Planctomycetota bacterium]
MAQCQAFEPNFEINGSAVLSVIKAMGTFRQMASNILGEHGIVAPEEGAWYSQQAWLDTFRDIAETMGVILQLNDETDLGTCRRDACGSFFSRFRIQETGCVLDQEHVH